MTEQLNLDARKIEEEVSSEDEDQDEIVVEEKGSKIIVKDAQGQQKLVFEPTSLSSSASSSSSLNSRSASMIKGDILNSNDFLNIISSMPATNSQSKGVTSRGSSQSIISRNSQSAIRSSNGSTTSTSGSSNAAVATSPSSSSATGSSGNSGKKKTDFYHFGKLFHQSDCIPVLGPGNKMKHLYYQCWIPDTQVLRGQILLIHGIHEHSARYSKLAEKFTSLKFAVFALDLFGHGKSGGKQGYVDSFERWIQHCQQFFEEIILQNGSYKIGSINPNKKNMSLGKQKRPSIDLDYKLLPELLPKCKNLPVFLFGQGIGGTICMYIAKKYPEVKGCMLSAPLVKIPSDRHYILQKLAAALSATAPYAGVAEINYERRCHQQHEVDAFKADPWCFKGKLRARVGFELLEQCKKVQKMIPEFDTSFIALHGTEDNSCDVEGSKYLERESKCKDKLLKLYAGFWHDICHEICSDAIQEDLLRWLEERIR